eukprot:scaffold24612_cov132-Cylindrotheca_fusiformis.AAC.1
MTAAVNADSSESVILPPPTLAIDRLRSANWSGSIPIQLSLAPSSLSSPTIPPPIHVLLPRHTFLHVGLKEAVMRLQKFAPPTISFTRRVVEEQDLGSSSEDEDGVEDTGTSAENKTQKQSNQEQKVDGVYPVCWFEDETTKLPLRWQYFAGILWDSHQRTTDNTGMPWKIRLHFTSYPSSQLLELDSSSGVMTTIERTFRHSLKQGLVLEHGHAKVALNMSKQSHERMWDSIVKSNYSIFKPLKEEMQTEKLPASIPLRLLVGYSKPPIQKRCHDHSLTLGKFLQLRLPDYFETTSDGKIQRKTSNVSWLVSGIVPPLSTLLLDLWRTLCHPDNFLYILILTE